ncbi:sugar transporter [Aliiroseovarius sp. YM-037]|uniref:sugar transporter n=1 Tax=Aliiroseovarius sp. YM-037 TaxID=3341728 RepID=UPI003A81293F
MKDHAHDQILEDSGLAPPARLRRRHIGLIASFVFLVLLPIAASGAYLFLVAKDQYASRVGFAVRTEETGSAVELLGGITDLSGSSTSDTDILYEYIQSQQMVRKIDAIVDLNSLYSAPKDPIFALGADPTIEDLVDHWRDIVKVYYDSGSKLIEIRVTAFTPQDAQQIATAVFDESSAMINRLSAIARDDATRYAREELEAALARLKAARLAMTNFRIRTQIVDPDADLQGRMGLLNNLQSQLATALIEHDILLENTLPTDTRVKQAERRIAVIEGRIREERNQFSRGDGEDDSAYATVVGDYESLAVDLEFAESAYVSALAAHDAAQAEAQRQSRYLAAFVEPTLAERAEYPKRITLLATISLFLFVGWATAMLIFYSIRDRR